MKSQNLSIEVSESLGSVSAILMQAVNPKAVYIFAHGAGAGMEHHFMEKVAMQLAENGISTLRYQFPYMENGKKRPDPPRIATAAVKAAVVEGLKYSKGIPILAGGKSFGGRMTSQAAADGKIDVDGIVFLGFPLHAPGKPSNHRAEHLYNVESPILFLQGTRDSLAKLEFLEPVIKKLGKKAELQILEGGDHSFKARKMDGITEDDMLIWITSCILDFVGKL